MTGVYADKIKIGVNQVSKAVPWSTCPTIPLARGDPSVLTAGADRCRGYPSKHHRTPSDPSPVRIAARSECPNSFGHRCESSADRRRIDRPVSPVRKLHRRTHSQNSSPNGVNGDMVSSKINRYREATNAVRGFPQSNCKGHRSNLAGKRPNADFNRTAKPGVSAPWRARKLLDFQSPAGGFERTDLALWSCPMRRTSVFLHKSHTFRSRRSWCNRLHQTGLDPNACRRGNSPRAGEGIDEVWLMIHERGNLPIATGWMSNSLGQIGRPSLGNRREFSGPRMERANNSFGNPSDTRPRSQVLRVKTGGYFVTGRGATAAFV